MLQSSFDDNRENSINLLEIAKIVATYAAQSYRAKEIGSNNDAWFYATRAQRWADFMSRAWDGSNRKLNPAVELARLRHAENYELAEEALRYWKENIDPKLSASKAANELIKAVPLSHKKLAEIISAAKKKHI